MAERQATVASQSGLHARPAKLFVQAVQQTGVPVTIAVDGGPDLNAGSILTLMGLGATQGTVVTLKAEGDGAGGAQQRRVGGAYHHNRSRAPGVPGGSLGEGMRRVDWLCDETQFGGLELDDEFLKTRWAIGTKRPLPCTFVLNCLERGVVEDEGFEHVDSEGEDDEDRDRPRQRRASSARR